MSGSELLHVYVDELLAFFTNLLVTAVLVDVYNTTQNWYQSYASPKFSFLLALSVNNNKLLLDYDSKL